MFFAGHGTYNERLREGYVIPPTRAPASGRTTSRLTLLARNLDAARQLRRVLLVLDVCFGGTFLQSRSDPGGYDAATAAETVRRYAEIPGPSCDHVRRAEYVSDGVPGRHSPFAFRLLEALRSGGGPDRDGLLTFEESSSYVRQVRRGDPARGRVRRGEPGATFLFLPEALRHGRE